MPFKAYRDREVVTFELLEKNHAIFFEKVIVSRAGRPLPSSHLLVENIVESAGWPFGVYSEGAAQGKRNARLPYCNYL